MSIPTLDEIITEATEAAKIRSTIVDDFMKNIDKNFFHAIRWAEGPIEARVYGAQLELLATAAQNGKDAKERTESEVVEGLTAHFRREMLFKAGTVNRSTSVMSNLLDDLDRKAVTKIYEYLSGEGFGL